jgi:hypothetical protein
LLLQRQKSVSWQLLMKMLWQIFTPFFRWPIFFFWEMSFYINSVHNKGGVVCIPVSETPPSIVRKPLIIYRGREKRARMCTTL